jgi:dephospho-CoA kinase
MSLEPWMADFVIDNNGSLEQLERNVKDLYNNLRVKFSRVKGVFA